MKLLTLPNVLSLLRLPLAAAFVIADTTTARVVIVVLVALSDLLDGFFARRMRSHDRKSGAIVDPITDKLFVLIALIALLARRELTFGQLLILISRDLYTSIMFIILRSKGWRIDFKSRISGKVVTVLQIATVLALLFWKQAFMPLLLVVAAASLFSMLDYSRVGLRQRKAARSLRA